MSFSSSSPRNPTLREKKFQQSKPPNRWKGESDDSSHRHRFNHANVCSFTRKKRKQEAKVFFSVGKRRTCKRDAEIFVNGHYAADTWRARESWKERESSIFYIDNDVIHHVGNERESDGRSEHSEKVSLNSPNTENCNQQTGSIESTKKKENIFKDTVRKIKKKQKPCVMRSIGGQLINASVFSWGRWTDGWKKRDEKNTHYGIGDETHLRFWGQNSSSSSFSNW